MKHGHARFLLAAALFSLVVLVSPYLAIRSNTLYCKYSRVFWNPTDCFKFALHDQSANIVLVGDSSLVFGARPNLLAQRLHRSAVNLGLPAGSIIFFPGILLDHYLARNRQPSLIVLYVSPWTLVQHQNDMEHLWNDGARVAIRHGTLAEIGRIFADDPRRLIQLPVIFMQQGLSQFSLSAIWWKKASAEMRAEHGWFAIRRPGRPLSILRPGGYLATPPNLTDACSLPVKQLTPPDREQIQRFRDAYRRVGVNVIVYVAPVPTCDPTYPAIVAAYRGVSDNLPQTLPGRYFIDDGWRVHVTKDGADQATIQIADFIKSYTIAQHARLMTSGQRVAGGHS